MNNNLEEHLRALRLDQPSKQLDHRMEELFKAIRPVRPAAHRRLWWVGLPVAGAIAASFLITSRRLPPPLLVQPSVYQIEAKGLMREWLLAPPAESQTPPAMIVTVQSLPSTTP